MPNDIDDTTIPTEPVTDPDLDVETPPDAPENVEGSPAADDSDVPADEGAETFPREYVEELRRENGRYRQRAQAADDLANRLHGALVAATGRLQDPTDLTYDSAHLDDATALDSAIDALLTAKPHLASRKVFGNIGQGPSVPTDSLSLSGLLRSGAN
jgi:hypothetical protein